MPGAELSCDLMVWVEESVRNTVEDLAYMKGVSQSEIVNQLLIEGIRALLSKNVGSKN